MDNLISLEDIRFSKDKRQFDPIYDSRRLFSELLYRIEPLRSKDNKLEMELINELIKLADWNAIKLEIMVRAWGDGRSLSNTLNSKRRSSEILRLAADKSSESFWRIVKITVKLSEDQNG